MLTKLRALCAFRGFILGSVKREFQSKYSNSLLGVAWMVIKPLAMILVYTVIFSQVMHSRLPGATSRFAYSIYLCSGLLTWNYFCEVVSRAQGMFLENANLIKKLNFPRICLPIIIVLNASVSFAIIFCLFIGFLLVSGNFPGLVVATMIPVLLLQVAFSIGLGMVVGVLNVFFRDVGQFIGIVLQFWFWITPIIYPVSTLPEWAQRLVLLNPMTPITGAYQKIFAQGAPPLWDSLWPTTVVAFLLCFFGMRLYQKHAPEIVDEL